MLGFPVFVSHSHSMVALGLGVTSQRTRLTPGTSEVMRATSFWTKLKFSSAGWAVTASTVLMARMTTGQILKPIRHFKAKSADDVYEEIKKIDWTEYLDNDKTFTVDSVVFSDEFRHSKFVSYKTKDAIVDQFREKTGKRPNISVANPDIRLNMHIAEDQCTLSLDSSGESLHRRGYRQESVEAPLNEVLAAGMILLSGWNQQTTK